MIEVIEDLGAPVVGLRAHGQVTSADYEEVAIPAIEAALAQHERIRVLYVLAEDFDGYSFGAMWEDAKLGGRGWSSWERVAVVTGLDWMGNAVRALGWLVPGEIRVFTEETAARAWLTG